MNLTRLGLVSSVLLVFAVGCNDDDDDNNNNADAAPYVDGGIMTGVPVGSTQGDGGGSTSTGTTDSGGGTTTGNDGGGSTGDDDSGSTTDGGGSTGDDSGTPDSGGGATAAFAVLRLGDGTATLSGTNTNAAAIELRAADGTLVNTYALPSSNTSGGNQALSQVTDVNAGNISLSGDGHSIAVSGFAVTPGSATSTAVALGSMSATGTFTSTTTFTAASGYVPRGAATASGAAFYLVGSTGGAEYLAGTTTTQLYTAPASGHQVAIFGGQLYLVSQSAANLGVSSIGNGEPTSAAAATLLTGVTTPHGNGAVLFDTDSTAGVDTCYLTDEDNGILKFRLGAANTWTLASTLSAEGGFHSVTGSVDNSGNVTLFASASPSSATAANSIYKITDTVTSTTAGTATKIATAATNESFRGLSNVPN